VREIVPVDLPRPRALSLMGDPRFGAIADGIRTMLRGPQGARAA
jgi:hypothetical protein